MKRLVSAMITTALVVLPATAVAQDTNCPPDGCPAVAWGRVGGLVFDSTRATPLDSARVVVMGTALDTITNEDGRFVLHGIPPGDHEISFWHPRLQELGVGPVPLRVRVQPDVPAEVLLAIPSQATLMGVWCDLEGEGRSDRVVIGHVTDSVTGVAIPGARVVLREMLSTHRVGEEQESVTDGKGAYRFCDAPAGGPISLQPHFGRTEGRSITVSPGGKRVASADLMIHLARAGAIHGKVVEWGTEDPVAGAELVLEGTGRQAVTDARGVFQMDDIPPGLHLLSTHHLAFMDRTDSVTVLGDEGVAVQIRVSQEPIPIPALEVTVRTRRGLFDPRTMGTRFNGLTSTEIDALLGRVSSMGQLLRQAHIPGLSIREVMILDRGLQLPALCVETTRRQASHPGECNMVEVYVDDVPMVAAEYVLRDLDPTTIERVQLLSGVEAGARYGGDTRNGVLLIWTRRQNR